VYGARNHVARAKFRIVVYGAHEALSFAVDQKRACASQGLCSKGCRITPNIDCGRMKLYELRICDRSPCASCDGDAFAACLDRVCGDRIEVPGAARRKHNRPCRENKCILTGIFFPGGENNALDTPFSDYQVACGDAF
jgi:hypothetical protein